MAVRVPSRVGCVVEACDGNRIEHVKMSTLRVPEPFRCAKKDRLGVYLEGTGGRGRVGGGPGQGGRLLFAMLDSS